MYPNYQNLMRFVVLIIILYTNLNLLAQTEDQENSEEIVEINLNQIQENLLNAPEEFSVEAGFQTTLLTLPLPNDQEKTFSIQESPVLSKKLSLAYPDIKSYILFDTDGSNISGRMSVTPKGVNYTIYTENGLVFLENFKDDENNTAHKVYYGDLKDGDIECNTITESRFAPPTNLANSRFNTISTGSTLRTYRIAIASSGEFTAGNGGTTASVNAVFNEKLNQLNAIFEKELTTRFILAPGNDVLIFTDAATDGLDVNNKLNSANTVISANMASSDYDIGHVFYEIDLCTMSGDCMCNANCASTSGVATLNSACRTSKARGWTGATSSASDNLFLGTFAHEIGHQFGAHHSYYGTAGNCFQRSPGNGYEPGSGNSIMSYEGTCGAHNITPEVGTNYFHIHSIIQMLAHAEGLGNCYTGTATGNTPPQSIAPADVTIPHGTPFTITGSGMDVDGDNLTYIWEQYDTDNSAGGAPDDAASSTTAPLFRSFDPSANGNIRTFPQLSDILNNTQTQGEILPQVARTMHFRLTTRDNNASGGGLHCDEVAITVDDSGVPFVVTSPTSANSYTADGTNMITINWNEGNTASAPINCSTVDIKLSIDGGNSFPIALATGTANDGTESIVLPTGLPNTSTARIKVACINGGVEFFDISDGDFTLSSSCVAQTSILCPTITTTVEEGDASLDLAISSLSEGVSLTSLTHTINNSSPTAPRAYATTQNGTTCTDGNNRSYERYDFTVDVTGSYSFSSSFNIFNITSIFLKSDFDVSNPCSGTLLGSNGYLNGDRISVFSPFELDLVTCTEYVLMVYANPTTTESINISGPGNWIQFSDQAANTNYTYIAINQTTNTIDAQSATADFTSLSGGATYNIYGVSYKNTETPSNWVGLSQSSLTDGTRCLLLSENNSTLIISAPPCSNPTPSLGTSTNPSACGVSDGSIQLTGLTANTAYTLNYNKDNIAATAINFTSDNSGNYLLDNLEAGVYTDINVTISNCTSSNLMTTLTEPTGSNAAVMSGNATICSGASTNITVAITGGISPYTLVYNDGSANSTELGYTTGKNISVSPTSNTTYTIVSVTDANGCVGTNNSGNAMITVTDLPTVDAISDQTVTEGDMIAAVNFSGTSGATYSWTNDNINTGIPANGTGNIGTIATTNPGVSTIEVTPSLNGCIGDSETFTITVNSASATCTDDRLNVDTSVDNETYSCDTVSSNQTIPANYTVIYESCDVIILNPGFHAVATSTFTARIVSCSQLNDTTAPSSLSITKPVATPIIDQSIMTIHPNPAKEVLNINYHLGATSTVQIGLYDLTGKNIVEIVPRQAQEKGVFQEQFLLSTVQPGIIPTQEACKVIFVPLLRILLS